MRSWHHRGDRFTEFRILDLPQRHETSYFVCLEGWSSEMVEADVAPPRWIEEQPLPTGGPGTVDTVAFTSGWCPASKRVYERARTVADEVGTPVEFTTIDTSDRRTRLRYGRPDAVFVNGRLLQRGAPPSTASIRRKIERQVRKQRGFGARLRT